jgi:hypothetical protein
MRYSSNASARPVDAHHCIDPLDQARLVRLVHVVIVPESGATDARSLAVPTEPARRRGIDRCSAEVAQQCNRIAFDEDTVGEFIGGQDDEWQFPDEAARGLLELEFVREQPFARNTEMGCGSPRRASIAPGAEVQAVSASDGLTNEVSKNGSSVVTAKPSSGAPVLRETSPQGGSRCRLDCMGSDADEPCTGSGVGSGLRRVDEEVDAARGQPIRPSQSRRRRGPPIPCSSSARNS